MYVITIICGALIWYLFNYYKWWKNIYRHMEKLPGPKRYPIVGTLYPFIGVPRTELFELGIRLTKKQGPFFRSWNGSTPEINIMKPEHMEFIMKSSIHLDKGKSYNLLLPWLGEGLLISTGAKWHLHRKLITPAFHFSILESFMETFIEKSKDLLKHLEAKANREFFDIYPNITNCTLDIICETAMGVSVDAMSNTHNDYVKSIYDVSQLMAWRSLRPHFQWDPLFYLVPEGRKFRNAIKILHNFSNTVISNRRKLFNEQRAHSKQAENETILGKKKRLSFLDLLLEASEEKKLLTSTDLREEVDTFIFEGHDTTTAAICWSLFLLGNYPEIQEKAYQEIKSVLQDKPTPTTLSDLNNLQYLECIIKEALRLYPSVPFILRSLTQDAEIDGYKIPAGVQVNIHIYMCHRDPEQFPDPEKFDPDRFLPENSKNRHPYAFVPFSAGPRNCIGQKFAMYEEKTILASIIQNYKITSKEAHKDIKMFVEIILRPQNGVNLMLEKRS